VDQFAQDALHGQATASLGGARKVLK